MLSIARLKQDYQARRQSPAEVIDAIFARIASEGVHPIWISLADRGAAVDRARRIDLSLPLAGIPFAVKDNIDVEGMPTTAGCPSFSYRAVRTAPVVSRLIEAGAILIGKTNLDQFATGLVGTRSPYGACSCVADSRYISGGSSSGSAVVVAGGLAAFALGTDTAGSGRVPAALNGLVGLKPTRGVLSTAGVVPACRSLDCVSIFTANATDAGEVLRVTRGFDPGDPYSRRETPGSNAAPWLSGPFTFGTPAADALEFFGDSEAARLFEEAARRLEAIGGVRVAIDFAPFRAAGNLLYGPWLAERLSGLADFINSGPEDIDPTVAAIVRGGAGYSAVDAHAAAHQLQSLVREAEQQWAAMDMLLLPTTGTTYTKAEIMADPIALNANLGYYTTFVNLMDLAAIAIPAGVRRNGLPFGVSFVGRTYADEALLALARRYLGEQGDVPTGAPGCIAVAVVGAHLSGQPLNHQLVERGARLQRTTRTAPAYRLFALRGTVPLKPGLMRVDEGAGRAIEVEVWLIPEDQFGGFVAAVPPPLGIGSVELETGEWVKGFICEPHALRAADDITPFGGWRAFLAEQ